ncbi:lip1 [Symbiodinium natans]|uniref:Lip1 protein n=1 Tax=Symbiodinium natans TaxID=878477 RepID=A0A812I2G2_9DINO|nr:lip1 [Symbiodinium natans]
MSAWNPPGKLSQKGTHYVLQGPDTGRLVVCVHGIGAYSYCFDKIALDLVQRGCRVLQYDLMGRGFSQPAADAVDYGAEGHVNQLRELLVELSLADMPLDMIAHSMGGALAVLYLEKYKPKPENNMRLVLLSPAGLMNGGMIKMLRSLTCMHWCIGPFLRSGQEGEWRKDFYDHQGSAELENQMMEAQRLQMQNNPHAFDAFFQSANHFPLYGLDATVRALSEQPIKTLIMWGKQDQAVPFQPSFNRWTTLLPAAETKVFDKAAHTFFLERPQEAADAISSFIGGQNAASLSTVPNSA